MLKLFWTPRAYNDLIQICDFIGSENITAAKRMITRIRIATQKLAEYPHIGRNGRVDCTRELVVPASPYIVVYRINGAIVEILSIIHGARRWPDHF
jgi:plasmid stabilization system protein ParE